MRRLLVLLAVLAVLAVGWQYNTWHENWYSNRCIEHASDIEECYSGKAAPARRWCDDHREYPGQRYGGISRCVQRYLAEGGPPAGQ